MHEFDYLDNEKMKELETDEVRLQYKMNNALDYVSRKLESFDEWQ